MKTKPTKWTHNHTSRLFHISLLLAYAAFFIVMVIEFWSVWGQVKAKSNSVEGETVNQTGVSLTVPAIYTKPAKIAMNTEDKIFAPLPDAEKESGSKLEFHTVSILDVTPVNNYTETSAAQITFNTARPLLSGRTDIPMAYIFIEIHSDQAIRGLTQADQQGNWSWQLPIELSPGKHSIIVTAKDPNNEALTATTKTNFLINIPGSKIPIKQIPGTNASLGDLFDIMLKIPNQFKIIKPETELAAEIKLVNFGKSGQPVDVTIVYSITNDQGKTVLESAETVAVATQLSLLKTFYTTSSMASGNYTLTASIPSNSAIATASDQFTVKLSPAITDAQKKPMPTPPILYQALVGLVLLFGLVTYLEYNKVTLLNKVIRQISEKDLSLNI